MKKDIAVAIVVGFIIGAIVAITVSNLPQILKNNLKIAVKPTTTPTVAITPIPTVEFSIDSPKDGFISDGKTVEIQGKAKSGQIVLFETETDQKIVEADTNGNFSAKLDLTEGVNTVYVTVYDEAGNSNSKTLNIFYTTEKL